MKTSEKVFWAKAVLALVTGGICIFLQESLGLQETIIVMAAFTIYAAVSETLAAVTKIDRNRTLKIGLWVFLLLWVFSWTLLNTLVKVASA